MVHKLKFYKSLVLPRLMYGAVESWALRGTGGTRDLPQWLPKADDGPPPRPRWPLHG